MRQAILYRTVPLAVLLLVLILLVVFHGLPTASKGLRVRMAQNTCECSPIERTIVLQISNNGELSLNADPVEMKTLAHHLSDIYSTRAERILYLKADDDVPFQRVVEAIETVQHSKTKVYPETVALPKELQHDMSDNLNIGIRLLTPGAVNTSCRKDCYNWGKYGFLPTP